MLLTGRGGSLPTGRDSVREAGGVRKDPKKNNSEIEKTWFDEFVRS